MRTEFAPLYRSTVGFDHLFRLLDAIQSDSSDGATYPPYNIERTGENAYRITMAIAGFTQDDVTVEVKETTLTVKAARSGEADTNREYLHRGIAQRAFERRFQLADFVEVEGASIANGLLNIDLKRNLPERMKPRTIAITADAPEASAKQIEAEAAA
jgi:molecular chaperone IbpA